MGFVVSYFQPAFVDWFWHLEVDLFGVRSTHMPPPHDMIPMQNLPVIFQACIL